MGIIQRQTARRIATTSLSAAHQGVAQRVVVGKCLVANSTVAPRVAIETKGEFAPCSVEAMLQPCARITAPAKTVACTLIHRVVIAQIPRQREVFAILEVYDTMVDAPIRVRAHPCGQVGLIRNIPVEVDSRIAAYVVGMGLAFPALIAACVAIGIIKRVGAITLHLMLRIVGIEVKIEVHLLICPHV